MNKIKITFLVVLSLAMTSFSKAQSILNVKTFIQGFYNPATSTMRAVIDPVSQPLLFDTITVKLADATNGNILFSEKKIFDVYGNTDVTLPAQFNGNSYYIVLNHRNSIETWSAFPVVINAITDYDFTTVTSQAYGDNLKWMTNAACIYSGDINQDGIVDLLDYLILNNDIPLVLYDYYLIDDLTGDSAVDLFDLVLFDDNMQHAIGVWAPFVVGVESHQSVDSKMSVYPNPASDFIKINTTHNLLYIYSADGKLISELNTIGKQLTVEVTTYPNGLYIMKTENNNESVKFMVHH